MANLLKKGFQFFSRLLKDPKRLGLGQKVPGKHPFGAKWAAIYGPKNTGHLKYQNGPKMAILKKPFSRFAHKMGKTERFVYSGVYLELRKHDKDIGKG